MSETKSFVGYVYLHTSPSGKSYVGQTRGKLVNRWCDQVKITRWPRHAGYRYPLSRAIRKYGSKAFEHQVLAVAKSKEELDNLERVWIILLQTRNPEYGYNITAGGEGNPGLKHSAAIRQKISRNRKGKAVGNTNAAGHVWTDEEKTRVSLALKGRKFSPEHIEKIHVQLRGRKNLRSVEINNRRWAKPGERERMSALAKEQRRREREQREVQNGNTNLAV
jgi:group I intron endonuclease